MIRLIKNRLLVSVALLATVAVNASKIVTTKTEDSKILNITLTEITKGEVLSIKDTNGFSLYKENLQVGSPFHKKLDFNTLPNGLYFLESKAAKEVNVTPILLKDNEVAFLLNATKTYKAPELKFNDEKAYLLVKNFDKHLVKILILNKEGRELFSESNDELLVYKTYDFSNLEEGTYTFIISQGGYSFTEEVKL